MESTDKRYKRLARKVKLSSPEPQIDATTGAGKVGGAIQSSLQGTEDNRGSDGEQGRNTDSRTPGRKRTTRKAKPGKTPQGTVVGRTVDDHRLWAEAREQRERSAEAIRVAVEGAALEVAVPRELAEAVAELGIGDTPGQEERLVGTERAGQVDWRRQLRKYVGQLLQVRPVYNRPPRRFPNLVGIIPGKSRRSQKPHVVAVLDTSGSITAELLNVMNTELTVMAKNYDVTVVECDCEIQDVYRYRPVTNVEGGGGTDFRPVFAPEFLRQQRPDLVVYFTDGFGPAPDRKPRVPVIWCIVPGGVQPADWGRVIDMQ